MAWVSELHAETDELRIWREYDDSVEGSVVAFRPEFKPGSTGYNRERLVEKLEQGEQFFRDAFTDWDGLTAAQKDARIKQLCRAMANVCRFLRAALDDEGI